MTVTMPGFRHEYKIEINYSDYLSIRQRLKAVMRPDNNASARGSYKITSLYFDNLWDKALKEKLNGVSRREKFRIRYYNQDFNFIRLEKKSKVNGLCLKESCRITQEECLLILNGSFEWMRTDTRPLIGELYRKMFSQLLKPKTIVAYQREPYVYAPGNVRITFDSHIETGIKSYYLFNPETIPTVSSLSTGILMEVKFDEFLPDVIRDIIQSGFRSYQAFSKYAACRQFG